MKLRGSLKVISILLRNETVACAIYTQKDYLVISDQVKFSLKGETFGYQSNANPASSCTHEPTLL